MHIAYIDGSGDAGRGTSHTYTLGCVLVDVTRWPAAFDDLINYRRFLRGRFGVPVRAEIKANYLVNNGGPFRRLALSESARFAIYRGHLRLQAKLGTSAFAVVVVKEAAWSREPNCDPREKAWDWVLQRLERFSTKGKTELMIMNDEGDDQGWVERRVRMFRRAGFAGSQYGTGLLNRPAKFFVDDAFPRQSHKSYFVQLADLDAYAAFRKVVPPPRRTVPIVPETMWDELGDARLSVVSPRGDGLVVWP